MLKKEDIYVKLTKKNIDKVVSILQERGFEYDFSVEKRDLKDGGFESLYLSYDRVFKYYRWMVSFFKPIKTRIKAKQLREILSTNYDVVPMEPNKQLEIGKWYKEPLFGDGRLMFKFNGKFGSGAAIGFSCVGDFAKTIGVHENEINKYEEATPEEVVKAFEYHFENFYD